MKKLFMKRAWICLLALSACLLLFPADAQAASPRISNNKITLTVGNKKTLKVKNTQKKVSWSSSQKSVAKVNAKGKTEAIVTAVKPGSATITAKVNGKKYKCKVTVKKAGFAKEFKGGNGTKRNPYKVSSLEQLKNVKKHNGKYFIQVADIDGGGAVFKPMFSEKSPFTGTYDGGGHTISNLRFRESGDAGIFRVVGEKGIIQNLIVKKIKFIQSYTYERVTYGGSGHPSQGAVVGYNFGKIKKCKANRVTSSGDASYMRQGGIVGTNDKGLIQSCTAKSCKFESVSADQSGGIIGLNCNGGAVKNCRADSITAIGACAGGIAGENYYNDSLISDSRTTGRCSFSGRVYGIGAISGVNHGIVTNCTTTTEYSLTDG